MLIGVSTRMGCSSRPVTFGTTTTLPWVPLPGAIGFAGVMASDEPDKLSAVATAAPAVRSVLSVRTTDALSVRATAALSEAWDLAGATIAALAATASAASATKLLRRRLGTSRITVRSPWGSESLTLRRRETHRARSRLEVQVVRQLGQEHIVGVGVDQPMQRRPDV